MTAKGRRLGSFERAAVETSRHAAFNAVAVLRLDRTPDRRASRSALDGLRPPIEHKPPGGRAASKDAVSRWQGARNRAPRHHQ